jgi:cytochrome P450
MEGQIAISTLLRRMPELKLNITPEQLRYRPNPTLRGLETIPVSF